jgi:hypothetical protein
MHFPVAMSAPVGHYLFIGMGVWTRPGQGTTQMDTATRNRQIKKVLTGVFGAGKVNVRGSRGTAYGWVSVTIDHTPLDADRASELRSLCFQLLAKHKIDLGRAYTDDTCQYETNQCHIGFNACRYFRTTTHEDGTMSVIREYGGQWESA